MKIFGVILVVLAVVSGYVAFQSVKPNVPTIICPPVVKLGELQTGAKKQVQFEIKNPSRFQVEILRIIPSCTCTAVRVADSIIPNSGTTTIEAIIIPNEMGDFESSLDLMFHGVGLSEVYHSRVVFQGSVTE